MRRAKERRRREKRGRKRENSGKRGRMREREGWARGLKHEEQALVYSANGRGTDGEKERGRDMAGRRGEIGHKKLEEKLR